MNKKQLKQCHKYSWRNKKALAESKNAGCFYCLKIYDAKLIKEWVDKGRTALCPCGIDAVLPDKLVKLNKKLLKEMHDYWFSIARMV